MTRRLLAMLGATLALVSCAPRARVDAAGILPVKRIAPVTFIGNRVVRPPVRNGQIPPPLPLDPSLTTSASIFHTGVPAFIDAMKRADRFEIVDASTVLAARAYAEFPKLSGVNAGTAQLAEGWRLVTPEDGKKVAALLDEIGADAALLTYWRFSLEPHTEGIGVDTAYPRTYMRAWLIDRTGKVIADDSFDVQADEMIAVYSQRYDARVLSGLFADPIETCAVRLVADLSNARADAREKQEKKDKAKPKDETPAPDASPSASPVATPSPGASPTPEPVATTPEPVATTPEPVASPEPAATAVPPTP